MTDDPILDAFAELNPVTTDWVGSDRDRERELEKLLARIRETRRFREVGRPPRHTRRLLPVRIFFVATAVVGLAVVLAFNLSYPGGGRVRSASRAAHPNAGVQLTGRLVADRTGTALASARNYILRADETTRSAAGGTHFSQFWSDQTNLNNFRDLEYAPGGAPSFETAEYHANGLITNLTIDFGSHEFTRSVLTQAQLAERLAQAIAAKAASLPPSLRPRARARRPSGPKQLTAAEVMRNDIVRGEDSLIGRVTLEGHPALLLADHEVGMNRRIWIDPATYLPIRMTAHGLSWGYVITYTWIPRSGQSVADIFDPPAPPGFTQVTLLPGFTQVPPK